MAKIGKIIKVAGPLVVAENMSGAKMFDLVHVSEMRLMGEIIEFKGDLASIQVYEETGGIGVGEPVYPAGEPLTVELGPGVIGSIYDGIQRPLDELYKNSGDFIARGVTAAALDRKKKWKFNPTAKAGDVLSPGDFLGFVEETQLIKHYIMVPPGVEGEVKSIEDGQFVIEDTIAVMSTAGGPVDVTMMQKWPVRKPRPYRQKKRPDIPLFTGQRIVDMFFPLAKGGTACVPGPFGSGKTVIQHQLAKWVDAEVIVYISNMPVAAREASVYTGITIAEYFRDMGYSVALMADSTSRWAEAMREISGRLEEMPGEEGYPAYLSARLASFYERAGLVECLSGSGDCRTGALSVIGAVSPPGGDLSDPVVQATLRVVKVFWSLEANLAYGRHFPAISWLNSYSLYNDSIRESITGNVAEDFFDLQAEAMRLLEKESELEEIVRLVGVDALSGPDRLVLAVSRMLREDFLHQNAFHDIDTYSPVEKQYKMIDTIIYFYKQAEDALRTGADISDIEAFKIKDDIARMKYIPTEEITKIDNIKTDIDNEFSKLFEEPHLEE